MPRSLKVKPEYVNQVKSAVKRNGFPRQRDLAEDLNFSLATVNNFLNGKPVDYLNFLEICKRLAQEWQEIADFDDDPANTPNDTEQEQEQLTPKFYLKRVSYESQCNEAILKPGALIRLKAPQQTGKTLLIERVLGRARTQGYQTLTLNFQLADSTVFTDLRQFLQWFCARVGQGLGLPNQLHEHWDDIFGCNSNATTYFQDYLLPNVESSLVLALDTVDWVFEHPTIADDFCRLLRGWYDIARRGDRNSILWKKLRLIVAHSTEVYSSLDINHSPLAGVGLVIELPELIPDEVQDLAQLHGLDWRMDEVEQLMAMVGGHPYLVQIALEQIGHQGMRLEELLQTAPTEAGIYGNHLRRHLGNLQQHPELEAAFSEVIRENGWVKIPSERAFKLHSMGLVTLKGNAVMPRCDLYRQYFCDRLELN